MGHQIPFPINTMENTMGYTKPCAQKLFTRTQLPLTQSPVKVNPKNPPFNLDLGNSHTPPYHLRLSIEFTGELPRVCMPYQVLQPYADLHANRFINFFHVSSW